VIIKSDLILPGAVPRRFSDLAGPAPWVLCLYPGVKNAWLLIWCVLVASRSLVVGLAYRYCRWYDWAVVVGESTPGAGEPPLMLRGCSYFKTGDFRTGRCPMVLVNAGCHFVHRDWYYGSWWWQVKRCRLGSGGMGSSGWLTKKREGGTERVSLRPSVWGSPGRYRYPASSGKRGSAGNRGSRRWVWSLSHNESHSSSRRSVPLGGVDWGWWIAVCGRCSPRLTPFRAGLPDFYQGNNTRQSSP